MKIQTLTRGPFGVNCYLLTQGTQAVAIDPGVPEAVLRQALDEAGATLNAMLLTHGHVDHIAFADAFPEVPLYVHELDAAALTDPEKNVSTHFGFALTVAHPATILRGGENLSLAGLSITVLHTPGHSPGGVCYQIGDALFCGDTVFERGVGRTDLPGGDPKALEASVRRVLALKGETVLYPGHGAPTTVRQRAAMGWF